jgi:hypothetical protein
MRMLIALLATTACSGLFAEGAAEPANVPGGDKPAKAHGDKPALPAIVNQADTDKDGALSAAEIAAVTDEKVKAKLIGLDSSKDGALDKAEIEAAQAAWKEKSEKKEKAEKEKKGEGEKKAEGQKDAAAPAK